MTITQSEIDQRVYDLYDEYCHGRIDRREFLARAAALGFLGAAMSLLPDYARAQTISFTDPRIKAHYVTYDSPGGNSGAMRGYLVAPAREGRFPAVLVVHENRGLNPYIEDVARRCAVEGFVALAPDGLWPVGGYPGNDDDGRELQAKLDQARLPPQQKPVARASSRRTGSRRASSAPPASAGAAARRTTSRWRSAPTCKRQRRTTAPPRRPRAWRGSRRRC